MQVGRVKGFVLLQETNWTPAQPATLTTAHPHINIAASNLPPEQTGSGGVCILPPLGWTQIEHTEIIPGFLQNAFYEKYGQVRVINVYVHPARTKEIGARLISHLAHVSDSCVVLGGDFNQLPNTQLWADLVAHFSCVSPKLATYLSGGIGSALDLGSHTMYAGRLLAVPILPARMLSISLIQAPRHLGTSPRR